MTNELLNELFEQWVGHIDPEDRTTIVNQLVREAKIHQIARFVAQLCQEKQDFTLFLDMLELAWYCEVSDRWETKNDLEREKTIGQLLKRSGILTAVTIAMALEENQSDSSTFLDMLERQEEKLSAE